MFRHSARILALGLIAVNAGGCYPPEIRGPVTESSWTVYRGDAARAESADEHFAEDPTPYWTAGTGRGAAASIAVGDSIIVIQETARRLTVLWRDSGIRAWRANLRGNGTTGPLIVDSLILAATGGDDGRVYAFRLETARPEWDEKLPFATGPMVVDDSTVYVASEAGIVVALDLWDGEEIWERRIGARTLGGLLQVGEKLVIATEDSVLTLDMETGETVGSVEIPAQVRAPAAASGGLIVFSSPEGVIFALDQETLELEWSTELGEASFGGPVIARDTVFATSISGKLWKLGLDNPSAPLSTNLDIAMRASPVPIQNGVIVTTLAGEVLRLEDSSEPTWMVRVDGPISVAPILNKGVLFVVDGRGKVHTWH